MSKRYNNYHKHTHISNIFTPDTNIKTIDYINRIIELGHDTYWTTEHGTGGDIFEAKTLCDKNGIKCKFGLEGYIVPNAAEKVNNKNYHIVLIPKDNSTRKKLNKASSRANKEGYYYKPRFFMEDLLAIDKDSLFITTACVAGIIRDENVFNGVFIPLVKHFGKNVFLEVQSHIEETQIEINKTCLKLSKEYGLSLIAANDSHYIYPEQSKDRLEFLKGKHINYGDEDCYVLDYPSYDTMLERFKKQGVLSEDQIKKAIDNTLIFDICEEIDINKEIKMPSIYPDMTPDERIEELKKHVKIKFDEIIKEENISKEDLKKYKQGIYEEMKVIEDTKEIGTADYFLFNEKNVDLAVNKYNGVLTRSGRGSCSSFYLNKLLGMTQVDRFKTGIPLYPERFMSTARLLENHALPDIDFNVVSQEPFIKSSKELLGENGCYPMIAYGTMQLGEAFRNVCRSKELNYDEFNEIAKDIENHIEDKKWQPYIQEAQKYVNTIVNASVHPCAFLLLDSDIESELGVVKIGENICIMITSGEADEYKYLKNDYLLVSVWKIISDTFKLINKPILTIKQLLENIDDKVWNIYKNGLTCTLNQVDGEWATSLCQQYLPKSVEDLSMLVSAIRPSFNSWRDMFVARMNYSTGSKDLDKVLESTNHFILFQENLMQYFDWLGISPAKSIGLIKKISKKKIKQEDFDNLENTLKSNWIKQTGSEDMFYETWNMIQSCIEYGFCSAHGYCTAIDSLYSAYLKANYSLEYYTVILNEYQNDTEKTKRIIDEMKFFNIELLPIKFGKSTNTYSFDKENNKIYKSIQSIKYCNSQIADELMELSKNKYNSFIDLLSDINLKTSVNSRQLTILTGLNFFSEFGNNKYLLDVIDIYNNLYSKKQISKKDLEKLGLTEYLMKKYSQKETDKLYKELDTIGLVKDLCSRVENKSMAIIEQIKFEMEYLEYTTYINPNISKYYYVVLDFKVYKSATNPYLVLRNIKTGEEMKSRIKDSKVFKNQPFGRYSILKIKEFDQAFKKKNIGGNWVVSSELEDILVNYEVVKN